MAENALTAVFILAAIICVFQYIMHFQKGKTNLMRCTAIVVPNGDHDRLEATLMYAYNKLNCGFNKDGALYFIKDNADENEMKIAEAFCKDHFGADIIAAENLSDILGDTVYKTARFVLY